MVLLTAKQEEEFNEKGTTLLTEDQYKEAGKEACAVWDSRYYRGRAILRGSTRQVQLLLFEDGHLVRVEWWLTIAERWTQYTLFRCDE